MEKQVKRKEDLGKLARALSNIFVAPGKNFMRTIRPGMETWHLLCVEWPRHP
jgi:hypothetical protein